MQLNFKSIASTMAIFVSRLGFLPANISPLGSFGFFGKNKWLFFTSIVLFDWLVGGFYPGFWVTYLGFAIYPLLGRLTQDSKYQLISLPLASLLFFLVSNLGVWWYWYPHTSVSLITCYSLAIPFYKRTLIGDLTFGYGYLLIKKFLTIKSYRPNPSLA